MKVATSQYLVGIVILIVSCRSYAKDVYGDFFQEIVRPSLQAKYLENERKISVRGGVIAKDIIDYMSNDIIDSMKEAEDSINEDCQNKGTYELSYEFNYVTENFVSFKRIITVYNCYANDQPEIDYVNIFNHTGTLMRVDFNEAISNSLKYSWKDVDEECNEISDYATAYSLLVNKSGGIEININKSPICDLNLKIKNEKRYLIFKRVNDK